MKCDCWRNDREVVFERGRGRAVVVEGVEGEVEGRRRHRDKFPETGGMRPRDSGARRGPVDGVGLSWDVKRV